LASALNFNDNPLVRKLDSIFPLTEDEKQALSSLPMQIAHLRADQDIVREGDRPSRSCVVLEGFACSYKVTGEGKRQIQTFTIRGDIPDLQSLHLTVLDSSIGTLCPCTVGFIRHEALRDLCEAYPRITSALWRETLVDAAIFREWLTNVGRRDAYSRIAHLLCELLVRLQAVGLADDHSCDLPMTQAEFGDAAGLSTVHVNRVLQDLRADGLIRSTGTRLTVLDWDGLKEAGDFDPTYLHLMDLPAQGEERGSLVGKNVFIAANRHQEASHGRSGREDPGESL
jgi:CRP-like cAMP-binding protein